MALEDEEVALGKLCPLIVIGLIELLVLNSGSLLFLAWQDLADESSEDCDDGDEGSEQWFGSSLFTAVFIVFACFFRSTFNACRFISSAISFRLLTFSFRESLLNILLAPMLVE